MEHDPLNDQTIINTNKYKIELAKNDVNIWITITLVKHMDEENKENYSYKVKISDFTLIDSFFNSFKGNIALIYKYLIRTFSKNLYIIEKDKTSNDILIVKMECLKENKKEHIQINLDSLNKIKKDEENEEDIIMKQEDNENIDNSFKNCLAAPLVGDNKNLENPNDKENFFYYKNKEKNNEYNIFIYKNEIKEHNYKEIIFKIIEKQISGNDEYYAHLNLVDFYNMSEFYFSQFNYSIDEIYDVLLIIFSNHNYKMEKTKNFLKIAITFLNTVGSQKSFIAKAHIISFKKDLIIRNINDILTDYNIQLIKFIKKFGDDINDEKFKNLIKDPDKYINERIIKNTIKKKNEIKKIINNIVEEYEKKNNIKQDNILNTNSTNKIYSKDINISNNNNIIINNKEIFDLYIKESKNQANKNKEKENIKEKINNEKMFNKKNKKLFDIMEDNIKIVIDKVEIEQVMKNFQKDSLKNNGDNIININENEDEKNLDEDKEEKKIDNYEIKSIIKKEKNKKIRMVNDNEEIKQIDKGLEKNKEIDIKEKNDDEKGKENYKQKEIGFNEIEKQSEKEKEIEKEKEKELQNKNEKDKQIETGNMKEKKREVGSFKETEKQGQIDIIKENVVNEKDKKNKKKKTEKIKYNDENISLNSIKGNSQKNQTNFNPFFLNHKRKRNLSINNKKYISIIDPIELFIDAVASRRKRFYNNTTLLSDFQLLFLLRKIEKTIPQFRYINIQIHIDIIFNYDIKQNYLENDLNKIKEFYQKSKNKKNLIFLIKTQNNKTFGGFIESGFTQNNFIKNNNYNSFIFSIDKMKIYDYIENNENCVFGYENKLPEFKNQIIFEDNNLKVGYTGIKKSGFLIEEDYELNDGNKMFYINQIQVISLNGFNF